MTKAVIIVLAAALLGLPSLGSALPDPDVESIPCGTVVTELTPCLDFITSKTSTPSQSCCDGVKDIGSRVKDKKDREDACNCLKNALSGVSYDSSRVSQLPQKCGLSFILPPISPNIDCSKNSPCLIQGLIVLDGIPMDCDVPAN